VSGTVADTLLANKAPASNFGTSAALVTGLVSATAREALLRFDLSAIPAGATINSAILTMYESALVSGAATINVHRVTAPWTENVVTYQSFNQAFVAAPDASFSNTLNPSTTPPRAAGTSVGERGEPQSRRAPRAGLCRDQRYPVPVERAADGGAAPAPRRLLHRHLRGRLRRLRRQGAKWL
jgi:hypothetical protein